MTKGYFCAGFGLGDVINWYFLAMRKGDPNPVGFVLPRIRDALRIGLLAEAAAVMESYNPFAYQVFEALDFPLRVVGQREDLEGQWHDLRDDPPPAFSELPAVRPISFPTRRPKMWIPREYVLFMDNASDVERCITDHTIYHLIANTTRLPVIKVGNNPGWHSEVPADIDLYCKTTLCESAWLGKHARLVVSAVSYLRTFAYLFNVPVIEILQDDRAGMGTIERTIREYAEHDYGLSDALNSYYHFPSESRALEKALLQYRLGGRRSYAHRGQ